jgi:acyl-coenzyme A thioesterase PaaI-like protein
VIGPDEVDFDETNIDESASVEGATDRRLHNAASRHTELTDYERRFAGMTASLRTALSALAASRPPEHDIVQIREALDRVAVIGAASRVEEAKRVAGRLWEITGRAQALVPPVEYTWTALGETAGVVQFDAFHVGNGAAHGGVIAAVFDEIMGRTLVTNGLQDVRTAHLGVNYRQLVPLETQLHFRSRIESHEGRKIRTRAELLDSEGNVLSDADALFLVVRVPLVY